VVRVFLFKQFTFLNLEGGKMKTVRATTIIVAALFLLTFLATAAFAVPQTINYQGYLEDSGGTPVNGTVSMTFSIYDVPTGGVSLWDETQNSVSVTEGAFSVTLGIANAIDLPFDVQYYLGVDVNSDGEMTPRAALVSVPYAMRAGVADSASSVTSGAVTASSIGENCAVGESLVKTSSGWSCGAACNPGEFISCYTGPAGTLGEGVCKSGTRQCKTDGSGFGACEGEVTPSTELCDALDNDCNGIVDDSPLNGIVYYADIDSDNYGDLYNTTTACAQPVGYLTDSTDCDDDNSISYPGAYEACDSEDNNCDTQTDEGCAYPMYTWVSGSSSAGQTGSHGTKGLTDSSNGPGARTSAASWMDAAGNLWLFGGNGYDALGTFGDLNDLWKHDGTNWTWMSGSDAANQGGVYGTKGVAAPTNVPGSRQGAVSWTDAAGNLWLFGGYDGTFGYHNDLWKYDGTDWTWISGSDASNQNGMYVTKGIPVSGNVPGARRSAVSWIDAAGNLWLFGGEGFDASGVLGQLGDLWKYDGTDWTWVRGSDTVNQSGVYGTKGVAASANIPGSRGNAVSWTDSGGNLWLFGGYGYDASGVLGRLNGLWKYDGANWTWMSGSDTVEQIGVYGTKGVTAPTNVPGARVSTVSWTDAAGNLWLFGGNGYDAVGTLAYLNDLWKYDGTDWTWVSGSDTVNQVGVYGTKGVAAPTNVPGAKSTAVSWIDAAGDLWLFGGYGYAASGPAGRLNDLWKFDGTDWTWASGGDVRNQQGTYSTEGVSTNFPEARQAAVSWIDSGDNLWLFGGLGYAAVNWFNDLWKFDGTSWTWISGNSDSNQPGVYGTKGVAAPVNVPGGREAAVSWTDSGEGMWLFGGYGYDAAGSLGRLNGLWKYDGTNWTWVSGDNAVNQIGEYGTKGVGSPANFPGARVGAVSWTDLAGDLWLFGGDGYDAVGPTGYLNDGCCFMDRLGR
jgi:N-acetylneuraminic acid mutarotase